MFTLTKTMSVLSFVLAASTFFSHHANAFVPEDLARLKTEKKCPGCDLREANLSGFSLSGVSLERVNLMWANLSGADLEDVVLY